MDFQSGCKKKTSFLHISAGTGRTAGKQAGRGTSSAPFNLEFHAGFR
jgi:hypothetical protein